MDTKVNQAASDVLTQASGQVDLNYFQWLSKFMSEGGVFMWVILVIWVFGVAIVLERWARLSRFDIDGTSFMNSIKKFIIANDLAQAIQICTETNALLGLVIKNGLKRANQSKDQVQDALEGTILEVVPKIEQRIPVIALMANVSTLFGLLGTIQGLISSFAAVAGADASEKARLLALGISTAMNTTALGLFSAITLMLIHAWLASKAERMIKQIEENAVKLMDILGTKKAYKNDSEAA